MLPVDDIIRIALREHDGTAPADIPAYVQSVKTALENPEQIPAFSQNSKPLSVVRFRCLLQDTGYPAEVYMPSDAQALANGEVDWSKLQERWIGWAVEIPGETQWARQSGDLASDLAGLNVTDAKLPPVVAGKFPLEGDYTGALLKVYDDVSYSPASAYEFIGVVSAAAIPSSFVREDDDADVPLVPALQVLLPPTAAFPPPSVAPANADATRAALVTYLATAFTDADTTAAELLLLALVAYPATHNPGHPPLGTLAVNFMRPATPNASLPAILASLIPALVDLTLTIPLLHKTPFCPASADGESLTPGLLQLAPGTTLLVDEDGLGEGGQLRDLGVKNVQALSEAIADQQVRYEYPYMDGLKMSTALRAVITSEAKSLLPADLHVPVSLASTPAHPDTDLAPLRAYLLHCGSPTHATRLEIPATVSAEAQETYVADRKAGQSADLAQDRLTRRMRIARLLALSYPAATLTDSLWARAVRLDEEVEQRLVRREEARRLTKIGAPTAGVNGETQPEEAAPAA